MSEESAKRATKKQRREQKGLKVTKGGKSCPGPTVENGYDLCESHQRTDSSIELTKESMLPRRAEVQLSSTSRTPSDTPPDTLGKVKVPGKRKRIDRDAVPDGSVSFETDAAELEPQRNDKRDECRKEDRMVSDIGNIIGGF